MSLKGGLSDTEIRNAISNNELYKYVDKGIISIERYNELSEIYGAIPSGERPNKKPVYIILCIVLLLLIALVSVAYHNN